MDTSTKTKLTLGTPLPGNKDRGYTSLDFQGQPDRNFDLNEALDYEYNSIDEILAYHVIEHLHPGRARYLVSSWVNCLKPGGKLVIECPDFDGLVLWYLKEPENKTVLQWIYGDDSRKGQNHLWGYNKERLLALFENLPVDAEFGTPEHYQSDQGPCLRIEVTKI